MMRGQSLGFGLAALALLAYAVVVTVHGLVNGQKLMLLRFQKPFTVNRYTNPIAFWLYTVIDLLACAVLGLFSVHFLSGLI